MALIDLFENFIISKNDDREKYYEIKDEAREYKGFLTQYLGYNLIIKEDFIKLEKLPALPEKWMGIKDFDSKKEYIFFMLLLAFLEDKDKEEQFILSNITEYIQENYEFERIDWTVYKDRKALINVITFSLSIKILKKYDGEENEFLRNFTSEVLYENTGISKYVVRRFNSDISECKTYEDLIESRETNLEVDSGVLRTNRVYRRLMLTPVVYKSQGYESDYEYIKNYRNNIKNNFDKYLNWDVHIHRDASMVIPTFNIRADMFPNNKIITYAVLFLAKKLRELLESKFISYNENDELVIESSAFYDIVIGIKDTYSHGFSKDLREASNQRFYKEMFDYLIEWNMISDEGNYVKVLALIFKFSGSYNKEYIGGESNEE
ncbi:MAG: TIGR02678 family protein [Sarcina sp.]